MIEARGIKEKLANAYSFTELNEGGVLNDNAFKELKKQARRGTIAIAVHPFFHESSNQFPTQLLNDKYEEYRKDWQRVVTNLVNTGTPIVFFHEASEKKKGLSPFSMPDFEMDKYSRPTLEPDVYRLRVNLAEFNIPVKKYFLALTHPNYPAPLLSSSHYGMVNEYGATGNFSERLKKIGIERVVLSGTQLLGNALRKNPIYWPEEVVITRLDGNQETVPYDTGFYLTGSRSIDDDSPIPRDFELPSQFLYFKPEGCVSHLARHLGQNGIDVEILDATFPERMPQRDSMEEVFIGTKKVLRVKAS